MMEGPPGVARRPRAPPPPGVWLNSPVTTAEVSAQKEASPIIVEAPTSTFQTNGLTSISAASQSRSPIAIEAPSDLIINPEKSAKSKFGSATSSTSQTSGMTPGIITEIPVAGAMSSALGRTIDSASTGVTVKPSSPRTLDKSPLGATASMKGTPSGLLERSPLATTSANSNASRQSSSDSRRVPLNHLPAWPPHADEPEPDMRATRPSPSIAFNPENKTNITKPMAALNLYEKAREGLEFPPPPQYLNIAPPTPPQPALPEVPLQQDVVVSPLPIPTRPVPVPRRPAPSPCSKREVPSSPTVQQDVSLTKELSVSGQRLFSAALDSSLPSSEKVDLPSFSTTNSSTVQDDNNNTLDGLAIHSKAPPPPPRRLISGEVILKLVLWDFDGSKTPGALSVRAGDKCTFISGEGDWTLVSYGKKSGLVPTSYLSDPPPLDIDQVRLAADRVPPRAAILEYGKESGFARDLIAIRGRDACPVTRPVVRFFGASAKRDRIGERVQVYVDGRIRGDVRLGEGGTIVEGNFKWDLRTLAPHAWEDSSIHALHVRFEHVLPSWVTSTDPSRFAECTLFVWDVDDVVLVSDVDGTITLSDVKGHLNTTLLIKAGYQPNSYAHPGVCTLFSHLARECFPCRFVYLTARPLDLCVETRTYLRGLKQAGKTLPLGPCITDETSYYGSLRREVVDKSSHLFKSQFLVDDLKKCFIEAGRDVDAKPVFMCGFGNKDTDAAAYRAAGVHPVLTFIIDSRSVVTAGAGYASELSSYDDPNLLNWVADMSKLFKSGKLPIPPS